MKKKTGRFLTAVLAIVLLCSTLMLVGCNEPAPTPDPDDTPVVMPVIKQGAVRTFDLEIDESKALSVSTYIDENGVVGITYEVAAANARVSVSSVENGIFSVTAVSSGTSSVLLRVKIDGTVKLSVTINFTVAQAPATAKLQTPTENMVRFSATNSFEIERGAATEETSAEKIFGATEEEGDFVIPGLKEVKVFLYISNTEGAVSVGEFTVFKSSVFSADGKASFTGTEEWQRSGNYYVTSANFEPFIVTLLGNDFDYGASYYVRSQFVAVGNSAFNSDLSPFSALSWSAAKLTVTLNRTGGSGAASISVAKGYKVTAPTDPTRSGYTFAGWYTSEDEGVTLSPSPFDFNTAITANMTLYAKWTSTGGPVEKVKLDTPADNFGDAGTGVNAGNFCFDRDHVSGSAELTFGGAMEGLDYVKVLVYDGNNESAKLVTELKIANAGNTISTMDGIYTHTMSTAADAAYNGFRSGNRWVIKKYVATAIYASTGKTAATVGDTFYFKFQFVASESSDFLTSDVSSVFAIRYVSILEADITAIGDLLKLIPAA